MRLKSEKRQVRMYRLVSLGELMQEIEIGMDIEFCVYGIRYNISWRDGKPFICTCPNGEAVFYDSPVEMFDKHKIKEKPLKDIWQDFEILFM